MQAVRISVVPRCNSLKHSKKELCDIKSSTDLTFSGAVFICSRMTLSLSLLPFSARLPKLKTNPKFPSTEYLKTSNSTTCESAAN